MSRIYRIVFALLAAAALAGGAAWWQWTHSPEYCLSRIGSAIANRDVAEFERLVDLQSVISRLADDALAEKDMSDNAFAAGLVQMMKPVVVTAITNMVRQQIESGDEARKALTTKSSDQVNGLLQRVPVLKNFEGVKYVRREGKVATVGLDIRLPKLGVSRTLDVRMRETDGYWRVAELSNFSAYTAEIKRLEEEKLKQLNQEFVVEAKKSFILTSVRRSSTADRWGINRTVHVTMDVKNVGANVKAVEGGVVLSAHGKDLIDIDIDSDKPWAAGETRTLDWDKRINQFIPDERALFETPNAELNAELVVIRIQRQDGSVAQILSELPDSEEKQVAAVAAPKP